MFVIIYFVSPKYIEESVLNKMKTIPPLMHKSYAHIKIFSFSGNKYILSISIVDRG